MGSGGYEGNMNNLTVVIPFYQGHRTILTTLAGIPAHVPVIVVDDRSEPALTPENVGRLANVRILRMRHKGYFAGAVNAGVRDCDTDVLVLNQDVMLRGDEWLRLLVEQRETYAMIGERIRGDHPAFPHGYIHGTFMFLRRDAIRAVGLLNERDYPLWGNTAEWQLRAARKGFRALPLESIPGFTHLRREGEKYGASIRELLTREPARQDLLVRTPPLVSVIVPCYNYGRYLPDCIASLVGGKTTLGPHPGQTMQSFEVIIVDDASTDDSAEIGRSLANGWMGIKFVQMPANGGTARALNAGIEQAVGKYITFLSADDMREPGSIEALVRACEANPRHFAYDDVQMFAQGRRLRTWRMLEYDFDQLLIKNHIHAGILYPRQAWADAGGYPPDMGNGREDWAFNIALGQAGWCGVHVRQFGYLYRREGQNRSLTNTTPEHRTAFAEKIRGLFPALYEGERPMGCCGSKTSAPAKPKAPAPQQLAALSMPGSEGMILLQYEGNQQLSTWTGVVTNTAYRFGGSRRLGYVDRRDAGMRDSGQGFLSLRQHGQWLFSEYQPQVLQAETQAVAPESVQAGAEAAAVDEAQPVDTETDLVVEAQPHPDPGELTIAQIKELDLTLAGWRALLDAEQAGRNRVGVVEHVEAILADE